MGGDVVLIGLVLVWIVGSILKIGGTAGGTGTRPPRRLPGDHGPMPGPLPQGGRDADGWPREAAPQAPPSRTAAEDLIPADLWEVLTGERRTPAPVLSGEAYEDEGYWEDEARSLEAEVAEPKAEEARSLETAVVRTQPYVVSLEEDLPSPAARHAAFHARIDAPAPRRPEPKRRRRSASALRTAVIMKEVLGPPKGLEE